MWPLLMNVVFRYGDLVGSNLASFLAATCGVILDAEARITMTMANNFTDVPVWQSQLATGYENGPSRVGREGRSSTSAAAAPGRG